MVNSNKFIPIILLLTITISCLIIQFVSSKSIERREKEKSGLTSNSLSLSSLLNNVPSRKDQIYDSRTNSPGGVSVWPWIGSSALALKVWIVAKLIAIFGWGWIMTKYGIGTKEFHDKYFQLTTTTTEKSIPANHTYGYYNYNDMASSSSNHGRHSNSINPIIENALEYLTSKVYTAFDINQLLKDLVN